jgi:plastocyanin
VHGTSETLLRTTAEWPPNQPPERRRPRWILRGIAAVSVCAFLLLVGFGLLAFADFSMAGNGSPDARARAEWTLASGDHLHFAFHIVAGRILDICPCTRRAAGAQYYRAHFHALTPLQKAVANNTHPSTPGEWLNYVVGPVEVAFGWAGDGLAWLGGQRPALEVMVNLDSYTVHPAEIDIARGTTVTWRNVDQLGEAHTVTADPGQLAKFDSDFLEPDESFSYTFTERGRYAYFCSIHGGPGLQGMSGLVVVQ